MAKHAVTAPLRVDNAEQLHWQQRADLVVVGFGGAGASAAIEAASRGLSVLVLERFAGGGATALSGGVVYAGGGTPQQLQAGYPDSSEAMFNYLRKEIGDAVSEQTLRTFAKAAGSNWPGWSARARCSRAAWPHTRLPIPATATTSITRATRRCQPMPLMPPPRPGTAPKAQACPVRRCSVPWPTAPGAVACRCAPSARCGVW